MKSYREDIRGKNILVVGLGKSGRAAVKVLLDLGAVVSVQDSADAEKIGAEYTGYLREHNVRMYLGCSPEDPAAFDMLVLSPGVPLTVDFVMRAAEAGAEIIGELELAYRITDARFVAITGTNGKTTTTTLVGEIFKEAGRDTRVVGNIGNPVVTEAEESDADTWMVAEVSSFQLETTKDFRPEVSAILNLTPDHLNRHKTMEAYGNAKARIAVNQTHQSG